MDWGISVGGRFRSISGSSVFYGKTLSPYPFVEPNLSRCIFCSIISYARLERSCGKATGSRCRTQMFKNLLVDYYVVRGLLFLRNVCGTFFGALKAGDYAAKDSKYPDYYSKRGQFLVPLSDIHIRKYLVFGVAISLNKCF